jgi:hypothetical protein
MRETPQNIGDLVGAVGIEIASLINKSWLGKGVAPPPFPQLVSIGVRRLAHTVQTDSSAELDHFVDLLVGI